MKNKDWNFVASCEYAMEEHLLIIAKRCAKISSDYSWAVKIATSICENPAVTVKVIKKLVSSCFTSVTTIAYEKFLK